MSEREEDAVAWVKRFFAASDALNAERVITDFYTEDAVVQYGNNPLIEGRQNIIEMFENLFNRLDMMKHEIGHMDVLPDRIYQYVYVSYRVKGDMEVIRISALAVFHKTPQESTVRRFDVFADTSPLMAKLKTSEAN